MPSNELLIAVAALIALAMLVAAGWHSWQTWLALKQRELDLRQRPVPERADPGTGNIAARIELADLRERVRKLEAIASGVDL